MINSFELLNNGYSLSHYKIDWLWTFNDCFTLIQYVLALLGLFYLEIFILQK
ncbi:MAG: hypothetical protein CENE_02844 [Candidatus Celerinatantimonas neptuna]|nr:MAG: hypothetical protein CENE_02844 [Candidatus Celerinatantimonas neptuna]